MSDDQRIPVRSSLTSYRAAVAARALSTRPASVGEPALEVIDGAGRWWERLHEGLRGDALAFLIANPIEAPPDRIAALSERAQSRPVIVERPLLRADIAEAAHRARDSSQPLMVVVECSAGSLHLPVVTRDAVGWIRILTGGCLDVRTSLRTATTCVAHLAPRGKPGPPAVLTANRVDAQETAAFLSAIALGERRVEVTIDSVSGRTTVSTFTAAGRQVSLPRYEESARLSIRRAVEAVAAGSFPADLDELLSDSRAAEQIFREGGQP